ncbi:MAG: prepilin-type N-terminal cleavage/methylation domain-containing protein [Syntrophus sp. (in: bacteria)]|nr:prepilin-type N-terminal cleavage/methylation domain-containing protein [Syntrophus sp. (in: bacteria)]
MISVIPDKQGFTLIEILVAMCLLLIALLALLSLTTTVIKGNYASKMTTMATTLVKDKLEDLKNKSYASVSASTSGITSTDYASATGQVSASSTGAYFTRNCTCKLDAAEPNDTMKTVVVTVSWNEGSRSVSASTIIGR